MSLPLAAICRAILVSSQLLTIGNASIPSPSLPRPPGVTTVELDQLAAETAAYMTTRHPDYAVLAARIAISNLHKETKKTFSHVIRDLYEYSGSGFFVFFCGRAKASGRRASGHEDPRLEPDITSLPFEHLHSQPEEQQEVSYDLKRDLRGRPGQRRSPQQRSHLRSGFQLRKLDAPRS